MQAIEAITNRVSVKRYSDKPVDKATLQKIIAAGEAAPTGMNRQSPIILAVTDKAVRDKLSQINASIMGRTGDPFYGAPTVLVVLADKSVPTYIYDGSLVMGNLLNAAYSLGVASCWIHRAKETFETAEGKELLKSLGISGEYEGIGNCILGYPEGEEVPAKKPRKANYTYYI